MISTSNPIKFPLTTASLNPKALNPTLRKLSSGVEVALFPSPAIDIVKLDLIFEAGSAYQKKFFSSACTSRMLITSTKGITPQETADFFEFRGIAIDRSHDLVKSSVSLYMMPRYIEESIPFLRKVLDSPEFDSDIFQTKVGQMKQRFLKNLQSPQTRAYNLLQNTIFGSEHPYGRIAEVSDFDKLQLSDVKDYYSIRYHSDCDIILSGNITPEVWEVLDNSFNDFAPLHQNSTLFNPPKKEYKPSKVFERKENAPQSAIYIGRTFDLDLDQEELQQLRILSTILGGYFGSRLMKNLREDKGYTYGIHSRVQFLRNEILLMISTTVQSQSTNEALVEIYKELDALCKDPVPEEELQVVKTYLIGDYLRNLNGVFEISDNYRSRQFLGVGEEFTVRYLKTLNDVTPQQLQSLAQKYLHPDMMTQVVVGEM